MYDHLPPQVGVPLAILLWFAVIAMILIAGRRARILRDRMERQARRESYQKAADEERKLYFKAQNAHIDLPKYLRKVR